jgi:hypothetical protein
MEVVGMQSAFVVETDDRGRLTCKGRGGIVATLVESSCVLASGYASGFKFIHTLQLRYPRFIHAEFMTHRQFSRNASSSRAIPVAKMLEQVRKDPAMPIHWGSNKPGMQAGDEIDTRVDGLLDMFGSYQGDFSPQDAWRIAAERAADVAEKMGEAGYHKQVVNRLLEPFQFMNVVVTATEWDNFFELRCHADAEPNFQELAHCIRAVIKHAEGPWILQVPARTEDRSFNDPFKWHLPYITDRERSICNLRIVLAMSAARCARVSYLTHDGASPVLEKDVGLFAKLVMGNPIHASPIEHQATPASQSNQRSGNFVGWQQFRQMFHRNWIGFDKLIDQFKEAA